MKYKQIKVCGHRRSGTHYITALISVNFLESYDYLKIYEKHKAPEKFNFENDTFFIYVWRDFDGVAKSIYNMRNRFGLNVDDYDKFLITKYSDMYSGNLKSLTKVDKYNKKRYVKKVGGGLKNIHMTPHQYWKFDKNRWLNLRFNNVICLKYDDVIKNYKYELQKISNKIGSNVQSFKNINKTVGWIPIGDNYNEKENQKKHIC